LGVYTPVVAQMGVKFGTELQISSPSVQRVAPAGPKTSK